MKSMKPTKVNKANEIKPTKSSAHRGNYFRHLFLYSVV